MRFKLTILLFKHLVQSNKCDIDARDEDKLTPLHESIIQKHENTAMLLVGHMIMIPLLEGHMIPLLVGYMIPGQKSHHSTTILNCH